MTSTFWINLAVMAGVTYLIRALPLVVFRKRLENDWIRSFLYYVPFAVLGAMTLPDIIFSTGNIWSAIPGLLVAVLLAYKEKSLIVVALSACSAVFLTECVIRYLLPWVQTL